MAYSTTYGICTTTLNGREVVGMQTGHPVGAIPVQRVLGDGTKVRSFVSFSELEDESAEVPYEEWTKETFDAALEAFFDCVDGHLDNYGEHMPVLREEADGTLHYGTLDHSTGEYVYEGVARFDHDMIVRGEQVFCEDGPTGMMRSFIVL